MGCRRRHTQRYVCCWWGTWTSTLVNSERFQCADDLTSGKSFAEGATSSQSKSDSFSACDNTRNDAIVICYCWQCVFVSRIFVGCWETALIPHCIISQTVHKYWACTFKNSVHICTYLRRYRRTPGVTTFLTRIAFRDMRMWHWTCTMLCLMSTHLHLQQHLPSMLRTQSHTHMSKARQRREISNIIRTYSGVRDDMYLSDSMDETISTSSLFACFHIRHHGIFVGRKLCHPACGTFCRWDVLKLLSWA